MKSKIFSLLTLLSIILALPACAEKARPTPAATATRPQPTATPTRAAPEPTTTAKPTETPLPTVIPTAEPTLTQADYTPVFEPADCPFDLPAGQVEGETVECGYLVVPEDRSDPDSRDVRLAGAIFHSPGGATEPDPIIYLSGGPGASALEFIYLSFEKFAPAFAANRDLIMFDQRGVGRSEPALDCPAIVELSLELLDLELDGQQLTEREIFGLLVDTLLSCKEDLSAVADLSAYNTAASAADVNDLRLALGYEQVNLWGASYGTRLALGVMRDYPEGVRSVVLDSVYPPDVDLYLEGPANASRAFNLLFESCAADEACNAAYPNLRTVFFDTVDRLNENPASSEITDPFAGESYDAVFDGDTLLGLLFQLLYETEIVPSLPQLIYDASQDSFDMLELIRGQLIAQISVSSRGMMFSVQCNEEFAFNSLKQFETVLAGYPELAGLYENSVIGKLAFQICEAWDSGTAHAIENPASSEITDPFAGESYDAVFDGDTLLGLLFQLLYETEIVPSLPQLIYDASQDSFDMLELIRGQLIAQISVSSRGMMFSVQCNEEFAFNSLKQFETVLAGYPELAGLYENSVIGKLAFQICEAWDSGTAHAIENQPVSSDIPTLVMAGEYDPVTPPAWARHAAETLENSFFFKYPGVGHGASVVGGCPRDMMITFLDDPTSAPDDACIAEMDMQFDVPAESEEAVEFEPFANEEMGISGLAPVGWNEAGPGIFARGSSGLDVAALIEQAAPMSAEDLLSTLIGQLGLDETPESVGEREANGLTWTLYAIEVQGVSVDVALTESDELALIVLLQSAADERDALYEAVFLPIVDALVPLE